MYVSIAGYNIKDILSNKNKNNQKTEICILYKTSHFNISSIVNMCKQLLKSVISKKHFPITKTNVSKAFLLFI